MTIVRQIPMLCIWLALAGTAHSDITRPPPTHKPTPVWMTVFIIDVDEVDNADQSFKVNVFFQARWRDPRLAHRQAGKVRRPLIDLWNPGLQIVNQQRVYSTFPEIAEIDPTGEVTYRQRVWGSFSQPLDLRNFPFDRQRFNIQLVAEPYSPEEIELKQDPQGKSGIADALSFPDWKVIRWIARGETYLPNPHVDPLAGFVFAFDTDRRGGYFVLKIIVPLILIVAMSWVVFWIDPKDGSTQITVAITTILTFIAYQFSVSNQVPRVSYLTRLDLFILVSTALIFASLIIVVVTTALARQGRGNPALTLDRWARILFPVIFAVVIVWTFVGGD